MSKNLLPVNKISLPLIISFQIILILTIVFCYNIFVIPNSLLRETSLEYWYWYLDEWYPTQPNHLAQAVIPIIKWIYTILLFICLHEVLSDKEHVKILGRQYMLFVVLSGLLVYAGFFVYGKYFAQHYRLLMTLISTELMSLVLLCFVLKLELGRAAQHSPEPKE